MNNIHLYCVICVLLLCSCDRSTEKKTQTTTDGGGKSHVEAKPFKGESFRTADGSSVITPISPEEAEFRLSNGTTLLCKYTEQEDALRVVASVNGTQQVIYFKRVPNGLSNEGMTYLNATAYAEEQQKQKVARERIATMVAESKKESKTLHTMLLPKHTSPYNRSVILGVELVITDVSVNIRKQTTNEIIEQCWYAEIKGHFINPFATRIVAPWLTNEHPKSAFEFDQTTEESARDTVTKLNAALNNWRTRFPELAKQNSE